MSDVSDRRTHDGTPADAKFGTKDALALGGVLGAITGGADWLILQCYSTGTFHWALPSKDLIEGVSYVILLPVFLWLGKFFSLIGDIITNRLQRDAGP